MATTSKSALVLLSSFLAAWEKIGPIYCNYSRRSGIAFILPTSRQASITMMKEIDLDESLSYLNFASLSIEENKAEKVKEYFKVVSRNAPSLPEDTSGVRSRFRFFLSYFSGYGGCDKDGNIYLLLGDQEDEVLYIKEIADILQKDEDLYFKKERVVCVLFFDLYLQDVTNRQGTPKLPMATEYDHIVIAFSGLQTDTSSDWSMNLFKSLKDKDIPFTDILNDVGPSSQYVSTTGQLFLNDSKITPRLYKRVNNQLEKSFDQGVMLAVTSDDNREDFNNSVQGTFLNLQFTVIDNNPIGNKLITTASDLLAVIKTIALYRYNQSYMFFSFYYSGCGDVTDDGRIYLLLDKERKEKVYLDWIVSLFKRRYHENYVGFPCLLFLELCLPDGKTASPNLLLLPTCDNFVVATSGLHEASVGRTPDGCGIWTQRLCQNINDTDQPLTVQLNATQDKLPQLGPQYASSAGLFFLKKPTRIGQDFEDVEKYFGPLTTATRQAPLLGSPPTQILYKHPRPDDIEKLLQDFADQWKEIGKNLSMPEDRLKNIDATSKPNIYKLVMMTNKVESLTWVTLCTAVGNIDRNKAEKIKKTLSTDSTIFSYYPD